MQRNDFIFTIGYKGSLSIVDKKLQAKYRKPSAIQLYEEGLIRPAVAAAIYDRENGDPRALEQLIAQFKTDFDEELNEQKLRRIYGIAHSSMQLSVE